MKTIDIHPFRVEVPQADLDDLHDRLARTRWPDELPGVGWDYGVPLDYVKELAEYWRAGFDWRKQEAKLNEHLQFKTTIDGQNVHFLHIRSAEEDALPLIATHGWPMSVAEYLDVIGPLTDPRAHGGDPADAFHLVIPSIPGYGFSGPTRETGWDSRRIAKAWAELMKRLGYARYGAHGNDAGSIISPELGRSDPEHVLGVHVTQLFSFPSGDPTELESLSEEEIGRLQFLQRFFEEMGAYNTLQSTQPQTLAYALADSPVGQLAWSGQLFRDAVDRDYILTNVTIYWLTGTAGSSARQYWEDFHAQDKASEPTTTPTGVAVASAYRGSTLSAEAIWQASRRRAVRLTAPMPELRHLRYFVAVAEELNFSRAARRLRMAQPPLSAAIRQLEAELGTALFRRSSREVALTEAGRVLLEGARRTLAEAEHAVTATRRAGAGETGRLRIGFSWSAIFETLPAVGQAFKARRPDVELLTEQMWNARMNEALRAGTIDVAISLCPEITEGLDYTTIRTERVVAVLSSSHPHGGDASLRLDALADEAFVLFPREYAPRLYDQLVGLCRSAGFEPALRKESFHAGWELGLLADTHVVALTPASVALSLPSGLVAVALDEPSQRLETQALSRSDDPSPALAAFLDVARGVFAAQPTASAAELIPDSSGSRRDR